MDSPESCHALPCVPDSDSPTKMRAKRRQSADVAIADSGAVKDKRPRPLPATWIPESPDVSPSGEGCVRRCLSAEASELAQRLHLELEAERRKTAVTEMNSPPQYLDFPSAVSSPRRANRVYEVFANGYKNKKCAP